MEKFMIQGGKKLSGDVMISGAKNAALPILFASLLSSKPITLHNVPQLEDVNIAIKLLRYLGCKIEHSGRIVYIDARIINQLQVPVELASAMRASIWLLGPLLARFGEATIALPGGCAIGSRPIDLHLAALTSLGAEIQLLPDQLYACCAKGLQGNRLLFSKNSVGATINAMCAATLAQGITHIANAACEPEIVDTAQFLKRLGARISGAGTNNITVEGVKELKGGEYTIMPDRIETGSFLIAAAISQGKVTCCNTCPETLTTVIDKLSQAGGEINVGKDWISVTMNGKRAQAVTLSTHPYPGFPTDMQAQFTLLNAVANGRGVITETVFENRFMHVPELIHMGAKMCINRNQVVSYGVSALAGANITATDLRASISLVLAGCIAEGNTIVDQIYHIDRGYEEIEKKLCALGAEIKRI